MLLGRSLTSVLIAAAFVVAAVCRPAVAAPIDDGLPIYKMVRSLEDVQDKIVGGDLGAVDMQRFMLETIDKRLRQATSKDFDDLRNVDAALIYAMSGGNPATLDLLISKDVRGNFDNRVTQALLLYMGGKGGFATKDLDETVPEYKSTAIGPYLALVAANAVMRKKPKKALGYFDWARLILPGTIVEEAALRRSLMITTSTNDFDRSVELARQYLWRFPKSPYAAQVASLFVDLVNNNFGKITKDQINSILGMMDGRRKQEVFLRIARAAVVGGKLELAKWAASQAIALDDGLNDNQMKLAKLYMGLSELTNGNLQKAKDVFSQIPDRMLGPDERRLRDAAEFILSEVERKPKLDSLTQAEKATPANDEMPVSPPQAAGKPAATRSGGKAASDAKGAKVLDANAKQAEAIDKFLSQGETQLNAIDEMIKKGDR